MTTFKEKALVAAREFKKKHLRLQVADTVLDAHGHPSRPAVTWSNEDLDPTPPSKRTWKWHNYMSFYVGRWIDHK